MSREANFNIITGQIKRDYPLNSASRRFSSQAQIKQCKANGDYVQQIPSIRRLGTSSDSKNFIYGYTDNPSQTKNSRTLTHSDSNQPKASLINASKLGFNLVTHTIDNHTNQNWQNTHKQAPFAKQLHAGRKNAPNYHNEFSERLQKNATDFHKKRNACTDICHIQKSYGVEKFFRKYK